MRMPASLELNETGIAILSIQNTNQTLVYSATVSLVSHDIEYKQDGSNQIIFDRVGTGEIKFWEPTFISHSSASGNTFISQVFITSSALGLSEVYAFEIPKRTVPIKEYWGLISSILIALGGFVIKQDLWQLVTNLLSGLPTSSKNE